MYLVRVFPSPYGTVPERYYYSESWKHVKNICKDIVAVEKPKNFKKVVTKRDGKVIAASLTCDDLMFLVTYIDRFDLSEYSYFSDTSDTNELL